MELLAGDRLGKYEVVGRLAAGGMAEVYLARSLGHAGFAKVVALKRMLPELASEPGFREMFMQEASVAARLNHPNIVQIFDFAEERGELYLAMEYVHGGNLRRLHSDSLVRSNGHPELRLCPLLAAHLGRCVARALAHAWQAPDEEGRPSHLIHRDVSPHNVLLSYEGDAKLADFGIARPAERRTSAGVLKGKLLYMAPEQLLGGALDARTDVFALGIVLYETALGVRKPLFEASNESAVKQALQSRLIVPPERMDADFPKSLSAVIMKALERDPLRRFQSAAELVEALGEAIHREAKSPLDCDLASYMRRLYGEPPPIRGQRAPTAEEPNREVAPAAPVRSELERRGDDPLASTVLRAQAEALRATPAAERREGTVHDRRQERSPIAPSVTPPVHTTRPRLVLGIGTGVGIALISLGFAASSFRGAEPAPGGEGTLRGDGNAVSGSPAEPVEPRASGAASPVPSAAPGERLAALAAAQLPAATPQPSPQRAPTSRPSTREEAAAGRAQTDGRTGSKAVAPSSGRKAAPEKRGNGTLAVHAKPWAFVWVDGEAFTGERDQEAAPLLTRTLGAGPHLVHVQDPSGREHSIPVVVHAGREVRVEETFSATP